MHDISRPALRSLCYLLFNKLFGDFRAAFETVICDLTTVKPVHIDHGYVELSLISNFLKTHIKIPCIFQLYMSNCPQHIMECTELSPLPAIACLCHWTTNLAATEYKYIMKLLDHITKKGYPHRDKGLIRYTGVRQKRVSLYFNPRGVRYIQDILYQPRWKPAQVNTLGVKK